MLPNYLVIGASRCGTSWLARNLRVHPEIYLPNDKELHYFDRHYEKGIAWYENYFRNCTELAIGEATPAYFYNPAIPELIYQTLPDVKLIVSLRNPIDRAYSHYWYCYTDRKIKKDDASFEEQLIKNPRLIEEGLYTRCLHRYFDLFPKDKILIMRYEEIKTNPERYMSTVYMFLEVDDKFKPPYLDKVVNSSATKSGAMSMHAVSNKLSKLGFDRISNIIDTITRRKIPSINKEERKKLLEKYFLEDINKLENMIDQNLSYWKI